MLLEEWMWMALALLAVTFAGTLRSLSLTWVSLVATILGAITWADKGISNATQLLIFGGLLLPGLAIAHFLIKPRLAAGHPDAEADPVIKAPNPRRLVHQTFTLTEPIINGFGEIEIEGTTWRLRGEDSAAGDRIFVMGVDGLERDLLIVTRVE